MWRGEGGVQDDLRRTLDLECAGKRRGSRARIPYPMLPNLMPSVHTLYSIHAARLASSFHLASLFVIFFSGLGFILVSFWVALCALALFLPLFAVVTWPRHEQRCVVSPRFLSTLHPMSS